MLAFIDRGSKLSTAKFDLLGFRGNEPDSLAQAVFDANFRARADAVLRKIDTAKANAPTTGEDVVQALAALVELQRIVDEFAERQIALMRVTASTLAYVIAPPAGFAPDRVAKEIAADFPAFKEPPLDVAVLRFIRP